MFYRLGLKVAVSPKRALSIAFFCVFMCSFGFTNFRIESDCENERFATRLTDPQQLGIQ